MSTEKITIEITKSPGYARTYEYHAVITGMAGVCKTPTCYKKTDAMQAAVDLYAAERRKKHMEKHNPPYQGDTITDLMNAHNALVEAQYMCISFTAFRQYLNKVAINDLVADKSAWHYEIDRAETISGHAHYLEIHAPPGLELEDIPAGDIRDVVANQAGEYYAQLIEKSTNDEEDFLRDIGDWAQRIDSDHPDAFKYRAGEIEIRALYDVDGLVDYEINRVDDEYGSTDQWDVILERTEWCEKLSITDNNLNQALRYLNALTYGDVDIDAASVEVPGGNFRRVS